MKRFLKISNEGFTLVELMIVVAIIGILATIAVPQYQKFQAKSKQTEIRLALGAIHTVEVAAAVDTNSYTGCLGSIGYSRDGTKFYYTVGFNTPPAAECGPDGGGAESCLIYQWVATVDQTTGNITGYTAGATCTDTVNSTFFLANQKADAAAVPPITALPAAALATLSRNLFTAYGSANLYKALSDNWSIDQNKNLINTQSGLSAP